ncbi:type IV pilus assembly protein PilP [Thiogranum longum]|uniref:Type IV pilus assembly protein PilP n=1 Tax=Thiogranum longum TaxID=1537524 RepID=A0A4R1HA36_9GAMM|nr:pilus assembly protein PilP [Thiogranum longum]TCK17015.1 type IV pilus assembly protein PilP [Thiogranum longum]
MMHHSPGKLNSLVRFAAAGLLAGSIAGCAGNNTEDLRSYVDSVKSRQTARVEPLPEFSPFETHLYQAMDARDPFTPPSYSTPKSQVAHASNGGISPDFNRPREPLESEPLDGLRMVGTLGRDGMSWALVRMSDSTIHRVKPGNYLGQNHGKIVSITESEVEVTEIVPDGLGGWIERQASLALSE